MKQMISVLSCLQEMNIAHRDIKPQNIVKMGDVYKIIDLDVGRSFENQNSNKHNHLNKENLFM